MEHPLSLIAQSGTAALDAVPWAALDNPAAIARWDALATRTDEPNPFYESWYLLPSLRALDPGGSVRLLVLTEGEELLGLLPIRHEARYYGHPLPHWRGWVHDNCFLGAPLIARGHERTFWRKVLRWADAQGGTGLFLHLMHCPVEGALHDALKAELAGRAAASVMLEERAALSTDLAPEAYLEASLAGKKRKELRRQHRRLGEEGELAFERSTDPAGWAAEFLELESRGWKGAAGSALAADPRTAALFRHALAGAAERGRLELLALRLDGRAIAMLANFITPPASFSFKTAFDEDYARYSPGVLLQCENLGLIARPDITFVDSCASADHPMIDHFWRERRTIARHSIAIGGPLRRALFALVCRRETGASPGGIA